MNVRFDLLYG